MEDSSVIERDTQIRGDATGETSEAGFPSILFESGSGNGDERVEAPEFFHDLNLDQVVDAITLSRQRYNLKPFFYIRLTSLAAIAYRHDVMRDLENEVLFQSIKTFSSRMRSVHDLITATEQSYYKYQKEAWVLDAVEIYAKTVTGLLRDLNQYKPRSRGLQSFRTYLAAYTQSAAFRTLMDDAKELKSKLAAIRYCLFIKDGSITVRNYDDEMDYSAAVEETFSRFKQGTVKDYLVKYPDLSGMDHVEAMVLERVAWLNPALFLALDEFCARNSKFFEKTVGDFDREIQFYLAYLEYIETFKRAGLDFCYPKVSRTCKHVYSRDGYDLALAGKKLRENAPLVCNDFALNGAERIAVVTGPNQGGKTTFARIFGQIHYLASLGCPVPGTEAQLFLFDRLFVHFEREEKIATLRGKLEDDLVRIRAILDQATTDSIVIINEIFSSTTLKDAVFLSRRIIERISALDLLCVCVTFLDELSSLNEKTVSYVAGVVPDNPTVRTHKIERKPADGLSYALAIAEKYRLTRELLNERIKR